MYISLTIKLEKRKKYPYNMVHKHNPKQIVYVSNDKEIAQVQYQYLHWLATGTDADHGSPAAAVVHLTGHCSIEIVGDAVDQGQQPWNLLEAHNHCTLYHLSEVAGVNTLPNKKICRRC